MKEILSVLHSLLSQTAALVVVMQFLVQILVFTIFPNVEEFADIRRMLDGLRPTLGMILWNDFNIFMAIYGFWVLFLVADAKDNKVSVGRNVLQLPFFLMSYVISITNILLTQIVGLMQYRRQHIWVKTDHSIRSDSSETILPS